jgi:hypothetical protein
MVPAFLARGEWQPFIVLIFHLLVVKPLALIVLGLNAYRSKVQPSSLPTITATSPSFCCLFFPFTLAQRIGPVAAADYFSRNSLLSWFSLNVLRIIPVSQLAGSGVSAMLAINSALGDGEIILFFPEGTRGEAERMGKFHTGVAHIVKGNPSVFHCYPRCGQSLTERRGNVDAVFLPHFCGRVALLARQPRAIHASFAATL